MKRGRKPYIGCSAPGWKQRIWESLDKALAKTGAQIDTEWKTLAEEAKANGADSVSSAIAYLRTTGRKCPSYYREKLAPFFE